MGPILVAFLLGLALLVLSTWLTARDRKTSRRRSSLLDDGTGTAAAHKAGGGPP